MKNFGKLTLKRERVRELSQGAMGAVAGGSKLLCWSEVCLDPVARTKIATFCQESGCQTFGDDPALPPIGK